MTSYLVRRTTLSDLCELVVDTPEAQLWGYMTARHVKQLLSEDSWSGLVDDKLVACGGLVNIWPGLAEAWIAVTPLASQHVSFVYRTVKLYLADRISRHKLRRVEAHIRADFNEAGRLAHLLGFKLEKPLINYGPNGETFNLVAKVI